MLTGAPVTYGVAIPATAPHPEAAADFLRFLLGPEGVRAFTRRGFRPVTPLTCTGCAGLPPAVKALLP